jgi:hypothetical protein
LKPLLFFLAVMMLVVCAVPVYGADYMYHQYRTTILVTDPEHSADLIIEWVEDGGGYYTYKSQEIVVLRVPAEKTGSLRGYLEQISEAVVEVSVQSRDLREQIVTLRSRIKSGEEVLRRNLQYLDRADVEGTLAIEREIRSLLTELESFKGSLRKLETDRRYAYFEVVLSFQEQTLPQDIPSSFVWINTIDFYYFAEEGP